VSGTGTRTAGIKIPSPSTAAAGAGSGQSATTGAGQQSGTAGAPTLQGGISDESGFLQSVAGKFTTKGAAGPGDAFDELINRLNLSIDEFTKWHRNFERCAQGISQGMAKAFNDYRTLGRLQGPEVTADQLAKALKNPKRAFDQRSLADFHGKALGDLQLLMPQPNGPPQEGTAPPVHSTWGPVVENPPGSFVQKITGSNDDYVPPDSPDLDSLLKALKVDLTLNAYFPELGIVSWASFYQNHNNQMRSIGYDLGTGILWINQLLTADMKPTVVDQFVVSVDFVAPDGKFATYAMHLDFDFKKCTATFAGPVLKLMSTSVS
jgi:hypothetical protein